jgi:hypothetical protein
MGLSFEAGAEILRTARSLFFAKPTTAPSQVLASASDLRFVAVHYNVIVCDDMPIGVPHEGTACTSRDFDRVHRHAKSCSGGC